MLPVINLEIRVDDWYLRGGRTPVLLQRMHREHFLIHVVFCSKEVFKILSMRISFSVSDLVHGDAWLQVLTESLLSLNLILHHWRLRL